MPCLSCLKGNGQIFKTVRNVQLPWALRRFTASGQARYLLFRHLKTWHSSGCSNSKTLVSVWSWRILYHLKVFDLIRDFYIKIFKMMHFMQRLLTLFLPKSSSHADVSTHKCAKRISLGWGLSGRSLCWWFGGGRGDWIVATWVPGTQITDRSLPLDALVTFCLHFPGWRLSQILLHKYILLMHLEIWNSFY